MDDATDAGSRGDGASRDHAGVDRGLASVPLGKRIPLPLSVSGQSRRRDELRGQQRGHPLLAATDAQPPTVFRLRPLDGQAELPERLVEGRQMTVPLGIGKHPVTVEDECRHHACPELPNIVMWSMAMRTTSARTYRSSWGGS